jgi:hypothetical protein
MITCAQAIRELFVEKDHILTIEQIIEQIQKKYPGKWKTITIRTHLIGCSLNHQSSKWYPNFPKFLFNTDPGKIKLLDPEEEKEQKKLSGGVKIQFASEPLGPGEKAAKAKHTLRKNMRIYLNRAVDQLEPGLKSFMNEELEILIMAGKIDLLAIDRNKAVVVVKIAEESADKSAFDQMVKSIALIEDELGEKNIRGLIVAEKFDQEIILAAEETSNISLIRFKIRYEFEKAGGRP